MNEFLSTNCRNHKSWQTYGKC